MDIASALIAPKDAKLPCPEPIAPVTEGDTPMLGHPEAMAQLSHCKAQHVLPGGRRVCYTQCSLSTQ